MSNKKDYRMLLVKELAEKGNKKAMFEFVSIFMNHEDKDLFLESNEVILCYLRDLSNDGNGHAMRYFGNLYERGILVEKDIKKAREWYEKAAEKSDSYALCSLGYIYSFGWGVEVDYSNAYNYFAQAAYMENVNAMYKLGDMYYYGNHVKEDKDAAFFWYAEALDTFSYVDYEEASILYRLGKCYLYGYGVKQDLSVAKKYLSSAKDILTELIQNGDPYGVADSILPKVKAEFDKVRVMLKERGKS